MMAKAEIRLPALMSSMASSSASSIAVAKVGNATMKAEPISTAAPSTGADGRRSATTPPAKYPTVSAARTVEISAAQV